MGITFSCPSCGRGFTVDDRLAGKRGKCKSCGGPIRIPEAAGGDDPYGLDDVPMPPRGAAADAEVAPLPSRAGTRAVTERPRKKRSRGGGPWGVPLRSAACVCIFLGLFLGRFVSPRIIPAEYATNPIVVGLRFLTGGAVVLGILLTVVSVVGATLSFLTGNLRAFTSENPSDRLAWISACVLTALVFGATYMSYRFGTLRAGFAGISPTASAPGQGPVIDPAAEAAAAQARVDEMRMRGAMFQRPDGPGSLSHRPHGPLIPRGAPFGGPQ